MLFERIYYLANTYKPIIIIIFMRKRNVGEKAKVLLDSLDLEILNLLNTSKYKDSAIGYGVLDMVKMLNVTHKTIKPHIDKLKKSNLILLQDYANTQQMFENSNLKYNPTKMYLISPKKLGEISGQGNIPITKEMLIGYDFLLDKLNKIEKDNKK